MKSLFDYWRRREHRLVTIGDSLTLGFNNGCIYRTDLNYPSMLVRAMGDDIAFTQPSFTAQGGIPLNLEVLIRGLSDIYGDQVGWRNYLAALRYLYSTTRRIKRYWDGGYVPLYKDHNMPYHNQSVWGFTVSDSWKMTEEIARDYIKTHPAEFDLSDLLHGNAMYTTTRCVVNPTFGSRFQDYSMMDNARVLAENGGIENLIVYLGANNVIGGITSMEIRYSTKETLGSLPFNRNYTVTHPDHFRLLFRTLGEKIQKMKAKRVFTATLPYVTIPPASRGINMGEPHEDGYFDYYTRFWVWDQAFDPEIHPYFTREQARELDQVVDAYNDTIREVAKKYGWIVVPLHENIGRLAQRRRPAGYQIDYPHKFIEALKRNPRTSYLVLGKNSSLINSDYIRLDDQTGKLAAGGIFSLDGLHPTTIGYGLIANFFKELMQENGVHFEHELDWDFIIQNDTLVTDPPYVLIELRNVLRFLSMSPRKRWTAISTNIFSQVMRMFSPGINHESGDTELESANDTIE